MASTRPQGTTYDSSPVYTYGVNLQPAERVAEEVTKLITQLAQTVRETGVTFSLDSTTSINAFWH